MLSRLVFRSKNLMMASKPYLAKQMVRPMSGDVVDGYVRDVPDLEDSDMLVPPNLPKLTDSNGLVFDPKTQSLEDFLNVRFGPEMATINDDKKPERDVKNFPRIGAPRQPDQTRLYLLPDSWFQYFYPKTGVTGPYLFFGGFTTFLLSKEWWILDHEWVTGFSIAFIVGCGILKFGPQFRTWYCTLIDENDVVWDDWQKGMINFLEEVIGSEKTAQDGAKQQSILFDAKRENIKLQLEAEFRRRQMVAFNEVRNRLEYLLAKQTTDRQFKQQHMVNWIIDSVSKNISPQHEKDVLQRCLSDLKQLSTKHKISLT